MKRNKRGDYFKRIREVIKLNKKEGRDVKGGGGEGTKGEGEFTRHSWQGSGREY